LCDLKMPAGGHALDGKSLAPLLHRKDVDWPDRTLLVHSQRIEEPVKWRKSAVMTDRWRLVNGKELYDMKADPSQKTDIAKQNPAVTKRLTGEYEKWWASVSEKFGEYTRSIIGSEHENPSLITCMDWHSMSPWNQQMIRGAREMNGLWKIDVAKSGKYRFELRRYPIEADLAITAKAPNGDTLPDGKVYYKSSKALMATNARLKVAGFDETKPVKSSDKGITFEVNLKKGHTDMQTWFTGKTIKKTTGAYYVYITKL
jgi:hypothetical protein